MSEVGGIPPTQASALHVPVPREFIGIHGYLCDLDAHVTGGRHEACVLPYTLVKKDASVFPSHVRVARQADDEVELKHSAESRECESTLHWPFYSNDCRSYRETGKFNVDHRGNRRQCSCTRRSD